MNTVLYINKVSGKVLGFGLMVMSLMAIAGCSDDSDELVMNEKGEYRVRISTSSQNCTIETRAADGYHKGDADDFGTSATMKICFVKESDGTIVEKTSTWTWDAKTENGGWSDVYLERDTYTVYAVIPGDGYASFDGTQWKITGTPLVSQGDILAAKIVGDFEVDGEEAINFECNHMTVKLEPQVKLNSVYSAIRSVNITNITVSTNVKDQYTGTVTYNGVNPEYTWEKTGTGSATPSATIFSMEQLSGSQSGKEIAAENRAGKALTTSFASFRNQGGYLLSAIGNDVNMTITYDVYSALGFLTRQNTSATNAISLKSLAGTLKDGTNYKLKIEVIPTYLYTLSDDDQQSKFKISDN